MKKENFLKSIFFVISNDIILVLCLNISAAHCVENKNQNLPTQAKYLILLFGAFDLNEPFETGRIALSPAEVIVHRDWNPSIVRFNDDIAILMLETEVPYSNFIRPICLMKGDKPNIREGLVAGWGKSDHLTENGEKFPRKLKISSTPNEKCYRENNIFALIGSEKSFCAGRPGVGVCQGDSGSAFAVKINNRFYFKGFVSSSLVNDTGCYIKDYAIYINAPDYFNFIQNPKGSIGETCGVMNSATSLVVGGKLSKSDQFPWVVSTFMKNSNGFSHFGTGSLVSSRHVIIKSTAVGFDNGKKYYQNAQSELIRLYFGTKNHKRTDELGSKIIDGAKNIAIYPGSKSIHPRTFNIAVVTMHEPIIFSSTIFPVCLWSFGVSIDDQVGETAYGVGYGWDETRTITGVKKHVPMAIDSMEQCRSYYDDPMKRGGESEFFCASGQAGSIAYTYDDPLYLKKNDRWYLRGIISVYKRFDSIASDYPILYENTGKFFEWIQEQIKQ